LSPAATVSITAGNLPERGVLLVIYCDN
jgi:hypothetical protein